MIVPRSPFAELIHAGFAPWIDRRPRAAHPRHRHGFGLHRDRVRRALSRRPRVDAVDVSPHALEVARRNVATPRRRRPGTAVSGRRLRAGWRCALRPDRLQPAVRQRRGDGGAAARVPARARPRAARRGRRPRRRAPHPRGRCRGTSRRDGALFVEVGDSDAARAGGVSPAAVHLARVRARRGRRVPAAGADLAD